MTHVPITLSGHVVYRGDAWMRLTGKEHAIFVVLFRANGEWVSRAELYKEGWPGSETHRSRHWKYSSAKVTTHKLRNKLKELGLRIETNKRRPPGRVGSTSATYRLVDETVPLEQRIAREEAA